MSASRQLLLDRALSTGRSLHVIAGIGADDLAGVGLQAIDAPLAALAWLRLEPGPEGRLEIASRSLSMRLDQEQMRLAAGRIGYLAESPEARLIELAERGPIIGHALESTLLGRISATTADRIRPFLVDLVDLAGEISGPAGEGERSLARLLGREPQRFPDPLERSEIFIRLYRPAPVADLPALQVEALLVEESGTLRPLDRSSIDLATLIDGTPERLGLANGLAMVVSAERLGEGLESGAAVRLLRHLGGAVELLPAGRVVIVDREDGAALRAALPALRSLFSLPQGS